MIRSLSLATGRYLAFFFYTDPLLGDVMISKTCSASSWLLCAQTGYLSTSIGLNLLLQSRRGNLCQIASTTGRFHLVILKITNRIKSSGNRTYPVPFSGSLFAIQIVRFVGYKVKGHHRSISLPAASCIFLTASSIRASI